MIRYNDLIDISKLYDSRKGGGRYGGDGDDRKGADAKEC